MNYYGNEEHRDGFNFANPNNLVQHVLTSQAILQTSVRGKIL